MTLADANIAYRYSRSYDFDKLLELAHFHGNVFKINKIKNICQSDSLVKMYIG